MPDESAIPDTSARAAVRALVPSLIREVANEGMSEPDVLAFWFGEPDEVTPAFIRDAGAASLARGETFYTQNFGIPPLREGIADYLTWLHRPTADDNIAVTASGMSALLLVVEALVAPADRVVVVTPLWPNLVEIPKILSGNVECVALSCRDGEWRLDLDRLLAALTPATRLLLVNSPNNPTGWTLTRAEQEAILARCRRHGIWLVADDVYERLYYREDTRAAPSFLDLAAPEERVISVNSFSKSWLMTGWRLGWIVAPSPLMPDLGKLIEYNTSCSPAFVQHAGVAAITKGEATVAHTRERFRRARDYLVGALSRVPGVEVAAPAGAMYAFFRVRGLGDSLTFCKRLVHEARLGLAPGRAFGPEGEGYVRWCFASDEARLAEAVARFRRAMT
ncbi:MAG TPA: pyridoxal phosphate-dependent aminotransferase [Casimicrobiaceae bacterium]|nr:pyridoxal phosphate-dependent aminotransferase [Casimicrobiaceae bacterium]